jgi:hypothetical protein
MGAADIVRTALHSELVRSQIGQQGKRIFKASNQTPQKDEGGNIIGWLWNTAGRIVSILGNLVKAVGIGFGALWGMFTSTLQYIWNFDWNQSDASIDLQIQQSWNALGGMLGGTLGSAFGYLVCGVVPAATVLAFNEPLGAYLLQNVSEELAEEFIANLSNVVRYTFISGVRSLILLGFKNVRKIIKANVTFFQNLFGDKAADMINAWGAPNSKPWSFAKAVESKVESIPNEFLKNFVEEFLEEAWDGCVEAGYVIANGIDSYLAAEKLRQQQVPVLGRGRYVEITPDRSNDRERILLTGPQEILRPMIIQTLSNHQLIENRDIGSMVGMPIDDYMRARPQSLRIVVVFYNFPKPPYITSNGVKLVRAEYAIPDLKISKCNWNDIKLACGGANGYMCGRFLVTANLSNGRQMRVYGATHEEAEDRLKALAALSTAEILGDPTPSENKRKDKSGAYLKKTVRVYPAYFTIMNQYKVAGAQGSAVNLSDGLYNRKDDKILLYPDTEPLGTAARIAELLLKPGAEET